MRVLGDYNIIKQLGHGSLGAVYLAEHRFMKRHFVLKVLPEELASDRLFIQRFEEDVKNLAALDHPNIVKIHNVSSAHGTYFLVTDCIVDDAEETTNLAQYLKEKQKLSEEELVLIVRQLSGALDYAHKASCIHRGIKLNNILVGKDGFYLSDFGLSRIVGTSAVLTSTYKIVAETLGAKDISATQRSFLQSYSFLAPEQKYAEEVGPQADIYAFGVLVYYLIMKEFPEGIFEMPSKRVPEYVLNWDLLIRACLARAPEKRAPSLVALIGQLGRKKEVEIAAPALSLEVIQKYVPKAAPAPAPVLVAAVIPEESLSVAERIEERIRSEYTVTHYPTEAKEVRTIVPLLSEMVSIPEGQYLRGCAGSSRDEMPRHAIELAAFAIDIHPVTNEQFVRFMEVIGGEKDANNRDIIRFRESRIRSLSGKLVIESGYAKHPVVGVTWYGAHAYSQWVGKRLPTEAEWEIAARGGNEDILYPTGEDVEKSQANFFSSDTTSVLSYAPNAYGLYDMAGNVYEWCHDWYDYHYYEHSAQEPLHPKGPIQGVYRVLRGGCWKSLKEDLRCSHRHRNNPGTINRTYGFRCAKDLH